MLTFCFSYQLNSERFIIEEEVDGWIYLSDITQEVNKLILKTDLKLVNISKVVAFGSKIGVLDSKKANSAFPHRLTIYDEFGNLIRVINEITEVEVDRFNKVLYCFDNSGLVVLNYNGKVIYRDKKNVFLNYIIKGSKIYYGYGIPNDHNRIKYKIFSTELPQLNNKELLTEFELQNPTQIKVSSTVKFSLKNNIVHFTTGLDDRLYKIKDDVVTLSGEVDYSNYKRSFSERLQSKHFFIGDYFFSYFISNRKKYLSIINNEKQLSYTINRSNYGIKDDLFSDKEIKFKMLGLDNKFCAIPRDFNDLDSYYILIGQMKD